MQELKGELLNIDLVRVVIREATRALTDRREEGVIMVKPLRQLDRPSITLR